MNIAGNPAIEDHYTVIIMHMHDVDPVAPLSL